MKEVHEIAKLFPLIEGEAYQRLVNSIKEVGLELTITTLDDKTLDGRNRDRACQTAGVAPRYERFEDLHAGQDPFAFVAAMNLERRHMTATQRGRIAGKMATMKLGDNRYSSSALMPTIKKSTAEAAKIMGVSPRTIGQVRRVERDGIPEVVAALEEDKISASTAETIVALSPEEQAEALVEKLTPQSIKVTRAQSAEDKAFLQECLDRVKLPIPWPKGANSRPVHPDGEIRTQQIRDAIIRLRIAEPQIGSMQLGHALREIFQDAKKIWYFEGEIDSAVKTWSDAVAKKARAREMLLEKTRQRREDKATDKLNKRLARGRHKVHGFEAAWTRFEKVLLGALRRSVFCAEDKEPLEKAIGVCLTSHFDTLRQKAAKPEKVK